MTDRVNWNPAQVGGWRVVCTCELGPVPVTFHPDDEEVARWVAGNHKTTCTWVEPTEEVDNEEPI